MSKFENRPNETYWGLHALNPWVAHAHSVRLMMMAHHIKQIVQLLKPDIPKIITGKEFILGRTQLPKYGNGTVLKIINRTVLGKNRTVAVERNIIYYDAEENLIRLIKLPNWVGNEFGYTPINLNGHIRPGDPITDSTSFQIPPSHQNGGYAYGVRLRTAMTSIEGNDEDGVVVNADTLASGKLDFERMKTYEFRLNPDSALRNLYGTEEIPQFFPHCGEKIRSDGLIAAMFNWKERPLQLTPKKLKRYSNTDDLTWSVPGGIVKDIQIILNEHSLKGKSSAVLDPIEDYMMTLYRFQEKYYKEVKDTILQLEKEYPNTPFDGELKTLGSNAIIYLDKTTRYNLVAKKAPLPRWTIKFKVAHVSRPNIGDKGAGRYGDKFTITQILPGHLMPKDHRGIPLDIIHNDKSTINRSNPGRNREMTTSAAIEELEYRIRYLAGDREIDQTHPQLGTMISMASEFYEIVLPSQSEMFNKGTEVGHWVEHLNQMVKGDELYLLKADDKYFSYEVDKWIWETFKLPIKPLQIIENNGTPGFTQEPIEVAEYFYMILYKTPDAWNAVTSPRYNPMGVPSTVNNTTRNSTPFRLNSIRTGEAEMHIFVANTDPKVSAEISSRVSAEDHKLVVRSFIEAENPSKIEKSIDRNTHPYRGNPILSLIGHYFNTIGCEMKFVETQEDPPMINEMLSIKTLPTGPMKDLK